VPAYCGSDIHDLATSATFEKSVTCCGIAPAGAERARRPAVAVRGARALPEPIIRLMRIAAAGRRMDALRTITSALGHYDAEADAASPQAQYRKAVRLTRRPERSSRHGDACARRRVYCARPVLSQAGNFLYMLTAAAERDRDSCARRCG